MKVVNKKRDMALAVGRNPVTIKMGIAHEVCDKEYQFLYSVYGREVERLKEETPKVKTTPNAKLEEVKEETPKVKTSRK